VKRQTVTAVPVTISLLLHAALFASLFVVLDFDRTPDIAMPLAMNATLVTDNAMVIPPPVEEPQVEEPPKVAEPPPPQPDTQEQDRLAAEQKMREEEARAEEARLQKIERAKEEAEKERLAEQERKRREAEAEEERRKQEAEEERRRQEAEEKRLADIERQRLENERQRREAEDTQRQEALAEESRMVQSMAASAKAAYIFAIQQQVKRHWVQPVTAEQGLECAVKVTQTPGGVVTKVEFSSCNGDATVRRSIDAAIRKASPLPAPRDPTVFDREVIINFNT